MLNDPEMIIFSVGAEGKRYCVHRTVVQSATMAFNVAPSSTAEIHPDIRILFAENTEVFDEFVSWLYTRNLTSQVDGSVDLVKLIRLYMFALMWRVEALKDTTMKALMGVLNVDFDAFFATVEKVFKEDEPYRNRIAQVLDTISQELISLKDPSIDKLLSMYASSTKWRCNRLKNMIMDTLQDTLLTQSQMLTVDQVRKVFEVIQPSADERIRTFCVALYHHQRFSNEHLLPFENAIKYLVEAEDFIVDYMHFEQEVMFCRISSSYEVGDDPRDRKYGSFPHCYFHVHDPEKNEKCHLPSDKRVTFAC
jgi:hypothetical protein